MELIKYVEIGTYIVCGLFFIGGIMADNARITVTGILVAFLSFFIYDGIEAFYEPLIEENKGIIASGDSILSESRPSIKKDILEGSARINVKVNHYNDTVYVVEKYMLSAEGYYWSPQEELNNKNKAIDQIKKINEKSVLQDSIQKKNHYTSVKIIDSI